MNTESKSDIVSDKLEVYEAPYTAQLAAIGKAIGYGRACQILGELWDEMLQHEYGVSGRGRMERRKDIEQLEEKIEEAIKQKLEKP